MTIFVTFNCRGLRSHLQLLEPVSHFRNKIKQNRCVIAIQETKIDRQRTKHQAVLTRFKIQFNFEPLIDKLGGLLLLVPYNWRKEVMGKIASLILTKNNLTKEVSGTTNLNPSYPGTDIISSFARIVENFMNDFTMWIGGDFKAIDPIDATCNVSTGDSRLKRYQQDSDSFILFQWDALMFSKTKQKT